MHKFFVPQENIKNNVAEIQGDDIKHILKVLRLQEGEVVSINNCNGEEFSGKIINTDKKAVLVRLEEKLPINNESHLQVYLYQGLPKSSKMDLIVQKNTELGISAITPVITQRVVVKSELGEFKKVDRWQRIALEACKQSKRSLIPSIDTPIEFSDMEARLKDVDLIIVPYENAEGYGIKAAVANIKEKVNKAAIVIGPEGGFEKEEIQRLKLLGAQVVTLGPRILRTETAGFTALALVMYELGDLGGII